MVAFVTRITNAAMVGEITMTISFVATFTTIRVGTVVSAGELTTSVRYTCQQETATNTYQIRDWLYIVNSESKNCVMKQRRSVVQKHRFTSLLLLHQAA
jgi:hypothetical protein